MLRPAHLLPTQRQCYPCRLRHKHRPRELGFAQARAIRRPPGATDNRHPDKAGLDGCLF
jgi:hypothetical protein